jgi:hypothetical protein
MDTTTPHPVLLFESLDAYPADQGAVCPMPLSRARIPGGWLVFHVEGEFRSALAFVPDPRHEWDGGSVP